ncbi:nitrogen regulation protein NR(II) [Candidatus Poribacteria bacterium]
MMEQNAKEYRDSQAKIARNEKLTVLGQLAGGVSHELRNPLSAIKNAAYFLNMVVREPDAAVKETLEILKKEVEISERIINSLLDFARPVPAIRKKVDIDNVVRRALSRIIVPENIAVASQVDEALSAILADPDQLCQVFENIMLNAIQAMPDGGCLIVKVEEESPEWIAISFKDTGIGVSEESMGKLFEPLFTTKARGIGLGLAIIRTLIDGHGGDIKVQSEFGEGAIFTVRLPLNGKEQK